LIRKEFGERRFVDAALIELRNIAPGGL